MPPGRKERDLNRLWRICAVLPALCLALPASAQTTAIDGPTLAKVRARGHLVCASTDPLPGFAQLNTDGRWVGFDVDFCRAVAAAVFGDPGVLEFRALSGTSRFAQLQNGEIDVIARNAPWTMRRDTGFGVRYTSALFYDGQAFMVPQSLGVVSAYQLDNLRVCVLDEGDEQQNLREFGFVNQADYIEVLYEDREDLAVAYTQGLCEAVSAPASWLNAMRRSLADPQTHRILPERISKSAFGPVVRADDEQWYKIVQWTAFALITAEEAGVTSLNIESLKAAKTHRIRRLLGLEGSFGPAIGLASDFMKKVIAAVGNYGEMFDRNFGVGTGAGVSRGQNALWLNGGLIQAPNIE
jgi:general L-amino acid transport system substrate-binding protein